jgi:hypothetical protein
MFAMTSMGAKVIESVNDGHGPYVFKVSGQSCHRIGSMRPAQGQRPEYAHLYIYDTANEVSDRMNTVSSPNGSFQTNEEIVKTLIQMLNTDNSIVKLFRTASERLNGDMISLVLQLHLRLWDC